MNLILDTKAVPLPSGTLTDFLKQLHHKSLPNATQTMIADWYGVDPSIMTDVKALCEAKLVYAYILHVTKSCRSFYDAAFAAGVDYSSFQHYSVAFDNERQMGSSFGRELDVMIDKHRYNLLNTPA